MFALKGVIRVAPESRNKEINCVSLLGIVEYVHLNHSTQSNHINGADFGELASQNEREITNR